MICEKNLFENFTSRIKVNRRSETQERASLYTRTYTIVKYFVSDNEIANFIHPTEN